MDINKELSRIFKEASPITRSQRQREIEDSIVKFNPDFLEMHDMLDAFTAVLSRGDQDFPDILHEMKQLKEALLEADATKNTYRDDAMSLAKWRGQGL